VNAESAKDRAVKSKARKRARLKIEPGEAELTHRDRYAPIQGSIRTHAPLALWMGCATAFEQLAAKMKAATKSSLGSILLQGPLPH
jgi:hypothetical protein